METLLVEVYLPAAGITYEMRLPRAMNSLLSGDTYLPSRSSLFAKRDSGRILDFNRSLEQNGVLNGTRLLLI